MSPDVSPTRDPIWAERKILLAVTGGIAVYKTAALTSRMAQAGASVRVIMTESATRFVTPLTFQALSGSPVLTSIWEHDDRPEAQHVGLARWCDLMVIAPATADILAKIASGIADDIVSLTALALPRPTPVLLAPAMNAQMWQNPVTQRNLATLAQLLQYQSVGPESGYQACRTSGPGRMSEPESIFERATAMLATLPPIGR